MGRPAVRRDFAEFSEFGDTGYPVVALSSFIEAIRDSGYRTPAHALAELVDNSLEAGATHVSITIQDEGGAKGQTIRVMDDGSGMPPATLQKALQFGGSTRFNAREGTGRYGMGLPCSALSLARRVDVYTWQSASTSWWTFLDSRAIAEGLLSQIPKPKRSSLLHGTGSNSGTVVLLSDCDRTDLQAPTATNNIRQVLGRVFRRAILAGLHFTLNGERVPPVDPLFRESTSQLVQAKQYGPDLEFPVQTSSGTISVIQVRFTELPIEELSGLSNKEKACAGISKGGGVSVVRAGREIDYGWFFMGGKRRENYDDWWRCEVEFEPVLDELFGLTHTKQRVYPTPALVAILEPHIESIARTLNRRTRNTFQQLASQRERSVATRKAERRDPQLEPPCVRGRSNKSQALPPPCITGLRYKTCRAPLPTGDLFTAELSGQVLTMTINTEHCLYDRLFAPLLQQRSLRAADALSWIELMLLAYCRAEVRLRKADRSVAERIRHQWAETLSAYLS